MQISVIQKVCFAVLVSELNELPNFQADLPKRKKKCDLFDRHSLQVRFESEMF